MFRHAKYGDRDELLSLWQLCFHDSDTFADWFFTERFLPEYCAVWEESGRIVCAAHSLPLHIRVRSAILPCAVIAGVATLPEYRGRGIMRATLIDQLAFLRGAGLPLVVYRPVDFAIYRSLRHYAVADKTFVTLPAASPLPVLPCGFNVCDIDAAQALTELHGLYARVSARYSGMISRSYADFALKFRDYACDDARCVAAYRDGKFAGYCFYYMGEDSIEGIEALALDNTAYAALLSQLASRADKRSVKLALPPDAAVWTEGAQTVTFPRTAAGVTNVSELLCSVGLDGFAVEVRDDVLIENAGVYDLRGRRTGAVPQLALDSGRLAQLIFGYASIGELAARGEAEIFDSSAADALAEALSKQSCFCADEY